MEITHRCWERPRPRTCPKTGPGWSRERAGGEPARRIVHGFRAVLPATPYVPSDVPPCGGHRWTGATSAQFIETTSTYPIDDVATFRSQELLCWYRGRRGGKGRRLFASVEAALLADPMSRREVADGLGRYTRADILHGRAGYPESTGADPSSPTCWRKGPIGGRAVRFQS